MTRRDVRGQLLLLTFPASLFAVYLLAVGCGDDEDPKAAIGSGCTINSDCNEPLVCVFRKCHTQCEATRDCPDGQRCMIGVPPTHVCQLPEDLQCVYNSECVGDQVCAVDGECRDQCKADLDCLPEQVCVSGTCADPEELVDGLLPIVDKPVQTTGQPCAYTSECPDGLVCRDGLCNLECLGDADCAPFPCDTTTNRCVYPDGGVLCVPGEQDFCGCAGGSTGEQVCESDGLSFGPCTGCADAGG